jgi:hypothetical protein
MARAREIGSTRDREHERARGSMRLDSTSKREHKRGKMRG